jgi:hypothetical protein
MMIVFIVFVTVLLADQRAFNVGLSVIEINIEPTCTVLVLLDILLPESVPILRTVYWFITVSKLFSK